MPVVLVASPVTERILGASSLPGRWRYGITTDATVGLTPSSGAYVCRFDPRQPIQCVVQQR